MAAAKKGKKGKKGSAAPTSLDVPDTLTTVCSAHLPSTATREQVSQHTMRHSIATGMFEDVKFFLFSRRKRSGVVYAPRPLFANSALVCKASAHFDFGMFHAKCSFLVIAELTRLPPSVFSAGFAESEVTDMNAPFPHTRKCQTSDYDYSADSDIEDDDEDDELDVDSGGTRQATSHHEVPVPAVVTDDSGASCSSVGTSTVFAGEEKPSQEVKGDEDTLEVQYSGASALCCRG